MGSISLEVTTLISDLFNFCNFLSSNYFKATESSEGSRGLTSRIAISNQADETASCCIFTARCFELFVHAVGPCLGYSKSSWLSFPKRWRGRHRTTLKPGSGGQRNSWRSIWTEKKKSYGVFRTKGAGISVCNWRVLVKVISPSEIVCGQMWKFCGCHGWALTDLKSDESSSELNRKCWTVYYFWCAAQD